MIIENDEIITASRRLLVVQLTGADPLVLPPGTVVKMEYYFSDEPSPDGFAAWQVAVEENCYRFAVQVACRGFEGGFRQQALNRYFARIVQKHRIERVLVRDCHGCTLDLVRIADLMHIPTLLQVPSASPLSAAGGRSFRSSDSVGDNDRLTRMWLADSLRRAGLLLHEGSQPPAWLAEVAAEARVLPVSALAEHLGAPAETEANKTAVAGSAGGFDYAIYEFTQRDHPLLMQMQAGEVRHFAGCRRVLDLGCGAGIFLQLLVEAGIGASGVERDPVIAAYGQGMGLDIITADALDYLLRAGEQAMPVFDGIYCSHFVEHLPVELVQTLLARLARLLPSNGILVLTFPDPESIRSQLLGFWRDPEHVRFYHPELITTLAGAHGFDLEWSSYDDQPHEVVPFALVPPSVRMIADDEANEATVPSIRRGWWHRLLAVLGLASAHDYQALAQRVSQLQTVLASTRSQQQYTIAALTERTDQLWAVNRTWAWNDNAVLKLRKRD